MFNEDNRPICYASQSLKPNEIQYAQIEKELLAIVYGCEKFNQYIYGREIVIQTDHKPLESIMKKPPRIQRLLIRLQKYQLHVQYIPGKDLIIADKLSRAPHIKKQDIDLNDDIGPYNSRKLTHIIRTSTRMKSSTKTECELQTVMKMIKEGWPRHKKQVPPAIRNFWHIRNDLHEAEETIMKSQKLVIPFSMRQYILELSQTNKQSLT